MKITNPKTRKLLLAVKRQILKEPKQFNMDLMFSDSDDVDWIVPNCGTAACIAGHGFACKKQVSLSAAEVLMRRMTPVWDFKSFASRLFGITKNQALRLCIDYYWPEPLNVQYNSAVTPKAKARIGAKRIDHILKTGE